MNRTSLTMSYREILSERLADARRRTDELFALLTPGAVLDRPIPERHRMIFYVGHLEAFDYNLIAKNTFAETPFRPEFDKLFAFGIDPVGGGLPNEPPSAWPKLEDVLEYRRLTRDAVDRLLERADVTRPDEGHGQRFEVAIEHRLMHAETLAYLIHQLPHDRKIPLRDAIAGMASGARITPHSRTVMIPEGSATMGLERGEGFGWDNEYERHTVDVPRFAIAQYPVTNAQYLDFVESGAYDDAARWTPADWKWLRESNIEHPRFWLNRDGEWLYRGMFSDVPLPLDRPAYVSFAEANAYARWRGGRALPTEAQFHRAAWGTPEGREPAFPWGDEPPAAHRGNFDFKGYDPSSVEAHPDGDSAFGVSDLLGNGWEWTSTPFAPFPGFKAFPFYPGYSADFFDGRHFVLKGGSPRTAAVMLRRSFRNWFQPHYPYVYAKFRLVDVPGASR